MTKEEILKALECHREDDSCTECPLIGREDCSGTLSAEALILLKENEPAPCDDGTSSTNKNILQLNKSTESIICQALKLAKIAAETGAEITYSDGIFVIKPKSRGDNNVIFD